MLYVEAVWVAVWKRVSRHRAFQKGVSLLRTKNRDKLGAESTEGWQLLIGQGESTVFMSYDE